MEEHRHERINHDPHRRDRSAGAWGGVNLELLARLRLMEDKITGLQQELDAVKNSRAGNEPGLVRLSSSQSVTDSTGLALPTSENNAAVAGTLANRIEATKKNVRYTYSENAAYVSTNWGCIREKNNTVFLNFIVETKAMSSHTSHLIASSPLKPSERVEVQTVTDRGILVSLALHENGEMYIYPRANIEDKDLIRVQFSYFRN